MTEGKILEGEKVCKKCKHVYKKDHYSLFDEMKICGICDGDLVER